MMKCEGYQRGEKQRHLTPGDGSLCLLRKSYLRCANRLGTPCAVLGVGRSFLNQSTCPTRSGAGGLRHRMYSNNLTRWRKQTYLSDEAYDHAVGIRRPKHLDERTRYCYSAAHNEPYRGKEAMPLGALARHKVRRRPSHLSTHLPYVLMIGMCMFSLDSKRIQPSPILESLVSSKHVSEN